MKKEWNIPTVRDLAVSETKESYAECPYYNRESGVVMKSTSDKWGTVHCCYCDKREVEGKTCPGLDAYLKNGIPCSV